jgi:hypothetical protein
MGFTTLFHGMDVHGISAGYSMANPMGYLIGCPMALHIVSHGMYPVISHGFCRGSHGRPWDSSKLNVDIASDPLGYFAPDAA